MNNRYEFVLLFDVRDGNPNGDPDAGNMPRLDMETSQGLVSDVCLKRKIRNFIQLTQEDKLGYDIYVKEKAILNNQHDRAYKALGIEAKNAKQGADESARAWMCENFFDVRTFGAVMTTGVNCGQVRGPVQITFARSIDPIVSTEHAITRMAVTTEKDAEKQDGGNKTMGRKATVPYGLYRAEGFINPFLATQTGFSEADLELFWQALAQMFDFDRSASRGLMALRKLIIFKHADKLGNAPAHKLFERVKVSLKEGVSVPRSFEDYEVTIDKADLPQGIEILDEKV